MRRVTAGFLSLKSDVRRSRYYSQDKENTAAVQRKPAGRRAVMKEEGGGELGRVGAGGGTFVCATSAARRGGWVGGLRRGRKGRVVIHSERLNDLKFNEVLRVEFYERQ